MITGELEILKGKIVYGMYQLESKLSPYNVSNNQTKNYNDKKMGINV